MLHFELTQNHQKRLQQLAIAYDRIDGIAKSYPFEKRDFIATQSLISNIGASTRIENALLTNIEIEWIDTVLKSEPHLEYVNRERLIKDKLSKDKERSIEEVAGYREAIQIAFGSPEDFFPLSISPIQGLHREMLRYYPQADYHSGGFKKIPNTVLENDLSTGSKRIVLKTADPGTLTETAMAELIAWYNNEMAENPWVVAVAAEFVFRFLAIHPFQDGNGRLSRLLFHLALMAPENSVFRRSAPLCAIDRTIEQSRKKYYYVLQRCSDGIFSSDPNAYRYAFFLDYLIEVLEKSRENFSYYEKKYEHYKQLSKAALQILNCFKSEPEQALATGAIMELSGIPRRTAVYSLNILLDYGFVNREGKGRGSRYRLVF